MKIWYRAVCDQCGESIQVMVDNPSRTAIWLSEDDESIYTWMSKHYNCELRLIWRDDQLDKLWSTGFKHVSGSRLLKREAPAVEVKPLIETPKPGERYVHSKGHVYDVIMISRDTELHLKRVIYKSAPGFQEPHPDEPWDRPLWMFTDGRFKRLTSPAEAHQ